MLRVLVLSDLHYKQEKKGGDQDTLLWVVQPTDPICQNPMSSLIELIKENQGTTDGPFSKVKVLLCPGDITDRADKVGLVHGWQKLKEIKNLLNADELIATVGNHDVESRNKDATTAFNYLRKFSHTDYPIDNLSAISKFWVDNYFIAETPDFIIFVYNSSCSHSSPKKAALSSIDVSIRAKIEADLKVFEKDKRIRLGMCHHHPIPHQNFSNPDSDVIDGGTELIKLLKSYDFKILIHGHKHIPRYIEQNDLPVLGCGTFSSLANIGSNGFMPMFHLIEIDEVSFGGVIHSWIYTTESGWEQKLGSPFPCKTGFGYSGNINSLSNEIENWFSTLPVPLCKFKKVLEQFPNIEYLNINQQKDLTKLLFDKKLEFAPALPDTPINLSKILE